MKRIALINSLSGVAQILVNVVLVLVTVPVFIGKLGLPTYGIYALITAIGGVGVFTSFGFNTSLLKYLAEQRDRQESNYDIAVTLILIGGSSLLVAALSLVFIDFVLSYVLNIASDNVTQSVRSFYVACVGANVFQIIGQVPSAVLDSQQKVYITNGVQLFVGVASKGLILASLFIDPSLASVGWILLASSFVATCFLSWFALSVWGSVSCPVLRQRFVPVTRKHFVYGRSIYATSVMGFFYEPITKVLISHYVGLVEVGYFDLAFRIKGLVWSVLERLLYPILPLIANMSKLADIRRLLEEVERKLIVIVVPVFVASLFLSEPIVSVWLGRTLWPVVISLMCIMNCYLLAVLFVPVYSFLTVKGYPHKTLVMQSANVGINLLFFVCLVPWFGYYGALSAYCLAVLFSAALSAWYQWSILNSVPIASKDFGLKILKLGAYLLIANIISSSLIEGHWLRISVLVVVNGATTVLLLRWLRLITTDDVERYVGRGNRFGLVLEKLLVQGI